VKGERRQSVPRKKRPSQAELRAMGATPGLMAHRVGPDGRACLEQLTAEASGRPSLFLRPGSNKRSQIGQEGD
jgi:hypothetical protein